MKKVIIIGIILFFISMGIGYYYISTSVNGKEKNDEMKKQDELIYNTISSNTQNTVRTNNLEEKVSPNATLVLRKKYKKCGHEIKEYVEVPREFVNLTKEEISEKYTEWKMISFSSKEIVFYKEYNGICNEHYLIKEEAGNIVIYKLDENENEIFYRNTDIAVEYLTDEDRKKISEGIYAYSKEQLNASLEDFE